MIDTILGPDHLLHRKATIPNSLKDFKERQLATEWSLGDQISQGAVATVYNANSKGSPSQYIIKLFTPIRSESIATTEFLTHTAALSMLTNSGFGEGVAPKLIDYGVYKATPAIIESRVEAFRSEDEFLAYFKSLPIELRVRFLTDLATTMSRAALSGVYPLITKGDNLFLPKRGGVGILDFGKAWVSSFSPDHPQLKYTDPLYPEKHDKRHFVGTDSFIEFFRSLEHMELDIINDVGKPHQRIAGMQTLLGKHKKNPIKVDDLSKEVSVIHVEDIERSGT